MRDILSRSKQYRMTPDQLRARLSEIEPGSATLMAEYEARLAAASKKAPDWMGAAPAGFGADLRAQQRQMLAAEICTDLETERRELTVLLRSAEAMERAAAWRYPTPTPAGPPGALAENLRAALAEDMRAAMAKPKTQPEPAAATPTLPCALPPDFGLPTQKTRFNGKEIVQAAGDYAQAAGISRGVGRSRIMEQLANFEARHRDGRRHQTYNLSREEVIEFFKEIFAK